MHSYELWLIFDSRFSQKPFFIFVEIWFKSTIPQGDSQNPGYIV